MLHHFAGMKRCALIFALILAATAVHAAETPPVTPPTPPAKDDAVEATKKADATPEQTAKFAGDWNGKWVDVWKYAGQGGDLSCTLTAATGNELTAVFKAPGFMKEAVTVKLKVKADGSTNGSVDMGKPAGTLTFRLQLSADKFTGEYDSLEERGKFNLEKK